jgi:drug/metabolite transporter superfamily protein YnfA
VKLAAHVQQKPAYGRVTADAGVIIEAALVWTTVVVDDRRAEVIAVAERRTADAARNGVDRLHPHFILRS